MRGVALAGYGFDGSATDTTFDSADLLSPTLLQVTVDSGGSKVIGKAWDVPSGLTSGPPYYVIVHALGTTSSGASVESWTPLRGQVSGC